MKMPQDSHQEWKNYRILFDSIRDPVLIYKVSDNGQFDGFVLANKAFCGRYGLDQTDVPTVDFSTISAESSETEVNEHIQSIFQNKQPLFETLHRDHTGHVFPVEVHSNYTCFENHRPTRWPHLA